MVRVVSSINVGPNGTHVGCVSFGMYYVDRFCRAPYATAPLSDRCHVYVSVRSVRLSTHTTYHITHTTQVTLSLVIALVLTRLDCGNAVLAGLPARQLNRLQSVLHAAARLIYRARKFDHVTPLLRELHWLSVPERITFKLATLVFRCLHGLAPAYLAEAFNRAADVESRCRLRSGSSSALLVPTTRRRTLGDRAFAVAGARVWNSLPATLTSQPSLLMFRRQLKTLLFEQSFS